MRKTVFKTKRNGVLTRINGATVPGLEDGRTALVDMGLLKEGEAGDGITPTERTNIPSFLDRLVSLNVERQKRPQSCVKIRL